MYSENELSSADVLRTTTRNYIGNKIYSGTELSRILTEEGFLVKNGSGTTDMAPNYVLTDHLGNIRVEYSTTGSSPTVNNYYPSGTTMSTSLSFPGSSHPYKFSGKELDKTYNLNWYDFEARQYDPTIMRFTTIDPMREKYYGVSPYAYCLNNPVRYVDPTGESVWDFIRGTVDAIKHNMSWGTLSSTPSASSVSSASDYNAGRTTGDVISLVVGVAEMGGGATAAAGGVVVTVGSGGTAAVAGVPVAAAGVVEAIHGAGTAVSATLSLATGEGRISEASSSQGGEKSNTSSGNKNSSHANQKAKESAGQKYQDAKSQYEGLKSKPNKTPEDKKQLDSYKRQMDHRKEKQDFSGENHSQTAKGNR